MAPTADITRKSEEYDRRIFEWEKIRDALEGEDQIKRERRLYLPRPTGMDDAKYRLYLERAVFYGVADWTARGLVGLVFRVAPTINLAPRVDYLESAATPEGDPIDALIRDATREVVTLGRYGVLVDMGRSPAGLNEAQPFMATYPAESILRWDEEFDPDAGVRRLVRVVLAERPAQVGDQRVKYIRELFLDGEQGGPRVYRQQIWKDVDTDASDARRKGDRFVRRERVGEESFERDGEPITPMMMGRTLDLIPFWFINTFDMLAEPTKPPMLDLVNVNLAHYRNSADYEQLLHLVGSPTPWVAATWDDVAKKPSAIGAGAFWELPADASAGILEFSGSSADAFVRAMSDKEDRMAALGARLIRERDRSNVTAETTRMQGSAETSVLMSAVQNVEQAITAAMQFLARWAGVGDREAEDVGVELNKDFIGATMTPQELKELVAGWQAGAFSRQTLHENLQRGEIVDPKRSLEEELELIEQESPELPPGPPEPPEPPVEE